MEILSQDQQISNHPTDKITPNTNAQEPNNTQPAKAPKVISRKQMINEIREYKEALGNPSNFKKGSAFNLANLFIKLSQLNFTLYNLKMMSDQEIHAIWLDIKQNK